MTDKAENIGGAVIPIANRDAANQSLQRQGYGANMFNIPLGPDGQPSEVDAMCYMPYDSPTFSAVDAEVQLYGGVWVREESPDPVQNQRNLKRRLLALLGLVMKTPKE